MSDKNETPEQRFKRVASARANAVLEKLDLLAKCSNKRIYTYTKEDVDKIFKSINKQMKTTQAMFNFTSKERIQL